MSADIINGQDILRQRWVQHVDWQREVSSTNTLAIRRAAESDWPLPFLLGADRQTQGRGRGNHQWWASEGALTFSLAIAPQQLHIASQDWPLLSLVCGVALARTFEQLARDVEFAIKWPNDVYANGRKISGILIETVPQHADVLVVGVGVNVNNSLTQAAEDLRCRATSLIDLSQRNWPRHEVLCLFLEQLEIELERFPQDRSLMLEACRQRCFLSGKMITVTTGPLSLHGTCLGIDDDGALRLQTARGEERIIAGEIREIHG